MSLEQEPTITKDEAEFIVKSKQPPLHVYGLLAGIRRTGKTLEEVYNQAISELGNEEHKPAVTQARDFLAKNSKRFSLVIPPNESV